MTSEQLKALLNYNQDTGVFTWLVSAGSSRRGDVAGSCHKTIGYIYVRVGKARYLAHRLAFMWMTGVWPEREVDHINGNRSDNRWINLRQVAPQGNMQNIGGPRKHNKLGVLGVRKHPRAESYMAEIRHNRRSIYLGSFKTPEAAHAAYLLAKQHLHPFSVRLTGNAVQPLASL
jgi:HNH endonuclease/AP2 domain